MKNQNYKNFTIHHFEELESTNSHALELARLGKIFAGEVIVAKLQKSGRGRLDRKWQSPQGNLYFSVILNPQKPLVEISQISFVAAVALRLTLEKLGSFLVENKWPNDVLINGKKVAGILLESEIRSQEAQFVVLGVGVNIISNPENVMFAATNLKECGAEILPEELLQKFLDKFEELYQNWLSFGFSGIRKLWLAGAFKFGDEITVKISDELLVGVFEDLDLEGNLLVNVGGEFERVAVADVS